MPNIQTLFPLQSFDEQILRERSLNSHRDTLKYKIFVSTWNVGGVTPSDDLCLDDWLDIENHSYDIYVLGFQEIVPLSAKNVLGPEKRWISNKWNSLIRDALNKSTTNKSNGGSKLKERYERSRQDKAASSRGDNSTGEFRCIITKQMVGIMTTVWIRDELLQFLHQPSVSCIGCGVMGCLGNKGAVSVRFFLHETSFCFVCCHLASGGKAVDVRLRNTDIIDILTRTSFPRGTSLDLPRKILDHDRVVLLGDLNYRISLQEGETKSLVEQRRWSTLLEKDQLRMEFAKGRIFQGWNEGVITFSPTYKYYPNTDLYYGCTPGTKCDKKRAPAWCDRILWYGRGLKQIRYDRCESRLSDHRPVRAAFTTEVDVLRNSSSLGGFLMSDKLDEYVENFSFQFKEKNEEETGRKSL
ncbi:type I inositol 1,4,5-trisphosphate 5-phosphatase CVP2-like protein [Carex littledalei]|uniref:Type I inositol 1,4,5-trisphosphate 5-phosphatase CVP2-like protein n=1 Tax=Carex littledalei TaxID=544730 RepID=A0A833VB90_9POAL|nr:type I inositol 1,4,5-trisphosphate 5-phosphatase CVP2-like protein [Carex littledalei]